MSPIEAVRQAVQECQRFRYRADPVDDYWKTPAELERNGEGDCEDHAVWTIAQAYTLCPEADLWLVIGDVMAGRHAWVELQDGEGTWWADPTPGYGMSVERPWWFSGRTPLYAYEYDGVTFGKSFAYSERT